MATIVWSLFLRCTFLCISFYFVMIVHLNSALDVWLIIWSRLTLVFLQQHYKALSFYHVCALDYGMYLLLILVWVCAPGVATLLDFCCLAHCLQLVLRRCFVPVPCFCSQSALRAWPYCRFWCVVFAVVTFLLASGKTVSWTCSLELVSVILIVSTVSAVSPPTCF